MSLPASRSIKDGLLERVQTIARPPPSVITTAPAVEIKNVEYIGSYNWLDRKLPTIIVPGVSYYLYLREREELSVQANRIAEGMGE